MKLISALTFGAMAMVATPALAQEEGSMSGAYLGVVGGYDSVRLSADGEGASEGNAMYGVVLGYDFDLGSVVAGIEAEIADSSVSTSGAEDDISGSISADRDIYVGARLGAKVSSRAMIYAKAGYTNAKVKITGSDGTTTVSLSDELGGFRVGAGAEISFDRFAVRGEYRYSTYGDVNFQGFETGLSAERHQVVVALTGKF